MKTISVQIEVKTVVGYDPFGAEIYEDTLDEVPGCLIGMPTSEQLNDTMAMYGKQISYVVGIPKGDTHDWVDATIHFWGEKFRTIGYPETGIQENIPLNWGKNVKVERYG